MCSVNNDRNMFEIEFRMFAPKSEYRIILLDKCSLYTSYLVVSLLIYKLIMEDYYQFVKIENNELPNNIIFPQYQHYI